MAMIAFNKTSIFRFFGWTNVSVCSLVVRSTINVRLSACLQWCPEDSKLNTKQLDKQNIIIKRLLFVLYDELVKLLIGGSKTYIAANRLCNLYWANCGIWEWEVPNVYYIKRREEGIVED